MQYLKYILLFCLLACQDEPRNNTTEDLIQNNNEQKELDTILEPQAEQPQIQSLPAPKSRTNSSDQSVERELKEMENAALAIALQHAKAPQPTFNTAQTNDDHIVHYMELACEQTGLIYPENYNLAFAKAYPNSIYETLLDDGQLFCLNDLSEGNGLTKKIIYGRSEGGHYSDQIQILTTNRQAQEVYQLILHEYYAREGYERIIESILNDKNSIKRTINDRFGWVPIGKEDEQLRLETTQLFRILENGQLELLEESSQAFNFEVK